MKLNLGCGFDKRDGWVNADKFKACNPDLLIDIENPPWPIESNACSEILLKHVLEHVGQTTAELRAIIKENYRISQPNALISIHIPHYRHETFWSDPTHVRAYTPLTFKMMSKKQNDIWIAKKANYSMIAYDWDIDFEISEALQIYDPLWVNKLKNGELSQDQLRQESQVSWGVVKEYQFKLKVVK
jgi:hypothetical protein